VVQNPTQSLAGDVVATHAVIDAQEKPVVLVSHSYGGVVVTEAGNHPKVAGLVYITAFAPDVGESVTTLIANRAPGAPVPPILPPQNGFLLLDKAKFAEAIAADLDPDKAAFMAAPRFHGASARLTARSPLRPGKTSRVGIWSPRTIG
jgi:pimeloyl-ACP methyl ester carboxylesterase